MEMKNEIGTVVSTNEGPSPSCLDFVVNEGMVHRGQFVEIEFSEGILLALVTDIIKTNRYFERAESVKEFENSGKKLLEQFPTGEWEYLLARTKPLGVLTEIGTKRTTHPPSPGCKVTIASAENLKNFLNIREDGLDIGTVEYHSLPVKVGLDKLLKKHLAILSISGSGKSHLCSVILEEILNRTKEQGRIAAVVLDVHGEYSSFAMSPEDASYKDYSHNTKLIKAHEVQIGVPKLSIAMIANILPGLSVPQKRDLEKIMQKLRADMKSGLGPFDLRNVRNEITKDENIKDTTKVALIAWINQLEELKLFSNVDSPSITEVVKPGTLTIIDLSDIVNMRKKQILVSYFSQKMFFERRKKNIAPFTLFLEEAHQFIPEKATKENAVSKGIMRTIAREGRKFGASLCLISQRPIQLDTTTLSQCNSNIIMRITNPYDLKHIGESSEALDKASLDIITSLKVGEGLLVGEAVNYPVFMKVRQRKSAPSKHEKSLEQAAIEFEEKSSKDTEEAKEFLKE